MYIQTQDKMKLVKNEYISEIFIAPAGDSSRLSAQPKKARLGAVTDEVILLGCYDTVDQAKEVLEFVGVCIVDAEAQSKITAMPDQADMDLCARFGSAGGVNAGSALRSLLKSLVPDAVPFSEAPGAPDLSDLSDLLGL